MAMPKRSETNPNGSNLPIPEKYRTASYLAALLLLILVFFGKPLFSGGSFPSSDSIASKSFTTFLNKAASQGEFPLWNPYIFSGLPSFGALLTTGDRWYDFTAKIFFAVNKGFAGIFNNDVARIVFFYIIYAVGMYLLMRSKKHERFTSFFTAFAAVFSTYIIAWIMIGHNTKPLALSMFPFILMCLEKLREKFSIFYLFLLIVAVHILSESTHVQMLFYGVCTFGVYILFELISRIASKSNPAGVLRSAGLLAVAGAIAFGMSADRYLSVMEYKPYSTRGSSPIQQQQGKTQDEAGGFDYEYSTNWSFSPEETITFLVPNYFGFGKLEYKSNSRAKGQYVQTYWGQMPFTDAANYMGIFVLGLAIIAVVAHRKDAFVRALAALSLFSVLLSFGKNFPLLYDIFFYNVPGFNNFRAPMMALMMMQFAVPILAGYGIAALLRWRKEGITPKIKQGINIYVGASAFFLLLGLLYPTMAEESYISAVTETKKVDPSLTGFLFAEMQSDWIITGIIALAAAALFWLYINGKLKNGWLFSGLAALLVIDLWRVDFRAMETTKHKLEKSEFSKPEFVEFLEQDKSLYRVADFSYLTMGKTNVPAYFLLQNIHGYHSAKMRVYQDLMDVAGGGGGGAITNMFLLNMLNAKYLVAPQAYFQGVQPVHESYISSDGQGMPAIVYQNTSVLPRAFFVSQTQVADKMTILNHLKDGDFNPRNLAFTEEKIPVSIDTAISGNTAKTTRFENHNISIETYSKGNNLLFVSEIYYPVCWKAFVDGKEVPHYKTNFAFRSIVVPPGKHTVEWKYISEKYEQGKTASLALNSFVLALGAIGAYFEFRKKKTA